MGAEEITPRCLRGVARGRAKKVGEARAAMHEVAPSMVAIGAAARLPTGALGR